MNDQHITDRDLRAAFAARAAGAPNPDLAARISAEAARTRQSRPLISLPGFGSRATTQLAWAAVIAALTIALVGALALGVGRSNPDPVVVPPVSPSPEPSVIPSPSNTPTPSADSSVEPSRLPFVPAGLGQERIGRVVATDGLRVRSHPTVAETSERFEPLLGAGVQFYVVDGPVFADGYAWYQVDPYGGDAPLPFGWVAAGSREGDPWIERYLDGCDTGYPSVEQLGTAPAQVSLYCYGVVMPGDYELTGDLFCELADVDGLPGGAPWIEVDRMCELRAPDWNIHDGISLRIWGEAATSLLEPGSPVEGRYTVVGHFDDPASSSCEGGGLDGDRPDPAEAILWCRMQFVVTEVKPAA